jgi:hypothetical protein
MQVWTCYIISMPSGGLVANHNRNQCITSTLGWRKFTVNTHTIQSPFSLGFDRLRALTCGTGQVKCTSCLSNHSSPTLPLRVFWHTPSCHVLWYAAYPTDVPPFITPALVGGVWPRRIYRLNAHGAVLRTYVCKQSKCVCVCVPSAYVVSVLQVWKNSNV